MKTEWECIEKGKNECKEICTLEIKKKIKPRVKVCFETT